MKQANVKQTNKDEVTVLVHGIWMHGLLMAVLARRMRLMGFQTKTFSYDFLTNTPAINAQNLRRKIDKLGVARVNLVGHSLGGIRAFWHSSRPVSGRR